MSYVSHADLGGECGHGPVVPEPEGELFHAPWEAQVLALTLAMGATGSWNIDMSRSARETLANYRKLSYYQIWFEGLQRLLEQRGLVHADEVNQGRMIHAAIGVARVLKAENVAGALAAGSSTERLPATLARFKVGQPVRARSQQVPHHTRLPGYVRGKEGVIERVHGAHVFADTHSQNMGEQAQWLYTVVFDACKLWGDQASPQQLMVSVDAWEPYLESV